MRSWPILLLGVVLQSQSCRSDTLAPIAAAVVQLTVTPAEVVSGDTVRVVVSLANPTDRPMRFMPARSVCYLEFEARDSTGAWVGPSEWGCIAIVPQPVELAAHATKRVDWLWRVQTCRAGPTPGAICVDAAPGLYTLQGLADLGGPEPLQSPAVLLRVLPG